MQRYERVVKYLNNCALNNLGPKNGGSKQTQDLFERAVSVYEAEIQEGDGLRLQLDSVALTFPCLAKAAGDKTAGKIKMQKDPLFAKVVDRVSSPHMM
jgi:predicted helicase